jgi:integrase
VAKQPSLKHVKFTRAKGKLYAYFNTGAKLNGKPVYAPLPPFGSVGFYDSYAAMLGNRTKRGSAPSTVNALIDQYERSDDYRKRTEATQRAYWFGLKRVREELGALTIDKVERRHVREVVNNRITGNGSRNLFLAVVSVIYRYGRENDLTDANPTDGIKKFPKGEHEPWPDELLEAALACDKDMVRLAVHLLYYTGQRIGDVMKMRWSDIRDGAIIVTPQKTIRFKKVLRIPLHSALEAELDRTPRLGMTILTGKYGKPKFLGRMRFELQEFAEDLGFEIVPHGLRKNAVNSLLEAGCTPHEVAAITGQSFQMIEHYAKRVSQHRLGEAAILKLEIGARQKAIK